MAYAAAVSTRHFPICTGANSSRDRQSLVWWIVIVKKVSGVISLMIASYVQLMFSGKISVKSRYIGFTLYNMMINMLTCMLLLPLPHLRYDSCQKCE